MIRVFSKMILFVGSSDPQAVGYQYCALQFAISVGISLLMNWMIFTCCSGSVQIRSALIGAIYHKVR